MLHDAISYLHNGTILLCGMTTRIQEQKSSALVLPADMRGFSIMCVCMRGIHTNFTYNWQAAGSLFMYQYRRLIQSLATAHTWALAGFIPSWTLTGNFPPRKLRSSYPCFRDELRCTCGPFPSSNRNKMVHLRFWVGGMNQGIRIHCFFYPLYCFLILNMIQTPFQGLGV